MVEASTPPSTGVPLTTGGSTATGARGATTAVATLMLDARPPFASAVTRTRSVAPTSAAVAV